ncbi:MAG: T9SS type A sorting domain-containing protein [Patescibacteria group bacterium]|jgi:hypothetical protein
MKKIFKYLLFFLLFLSIKDSLGQEFVFNELQAYGSNYYNFTDPVFFNNKILIKTDHSDVKVDLNWYFNGVSWKYLSWPEGEENGMITTVEKENGELAVYNISSTGIYTWSDSSENWQKICSLPIKTSSAGYALSEKSIFVIYYFNNGRGIWHWNGEKFSQKIWTKGFSYSAIYVKDENNVFLAGRHFEDKNYKLFRLVDTALVELFVFPEDDYPTKLFSHDNKKIFILAGVGDIYCWDDDCIDKPGGYMEKIYECPEEDEWKYNTTIFLTNNDNIFIGGVRGVKYLNLSKGRNEKIFIPKWENEKFYSSFYRHNRAIFVGNKGFVVELLISSSVEEEEKTDWNIYPNPVADWLTIESEHFILTPKKVEIFNISGQLVLTQDFFLKANVDLSSLSRGTYLVILREEEGGKILEKRVIVKK